MVQHGWRPLLMLPSTSIFRFTRSLTVCNLLGLLNCFTHYIRPPAAETLADSK